MDKELLLQLIAEDNTGLLDSKSEVKSFTADDRLLSSFAEINAFVAQQGREPLEAGSLQEKMLAFRLKGIRLSPQKIQALIPYDEHALLKSAALLVEHDAFQPIIDSNDDVDDIFKLKHVPSSKTLKMPDSIARRKPCNNFKQYEELFKQCHSDLKEGKRTIGNFQNEQSIRQGDFFILKGIMVYVAKEGKRENKNGAVNARLTCIFENGTESSMLLRSLAAELYKNGRRVSKHLEKTFDKFSEILDEDKQTGIIYVLKSLSKNPEIVELQNLYKIGFSQTTIEQRIQNAQQDPTYLMSPVKIVDTYRCYNLEPQKLEFLLHKFFAHTCLDISILDPKGQTHKPREWFIVPIAIIEQAINMMINGSIMNYRYDHLNETIELLET